MTTPPPDPAPPSTNNKTDAGASSATSRKLLVLDLNGNLLYRVRTNRARGKPKPSHGQTQGSRTRAVYPRPYMPSFREYLSHPDTRAWLDVMAWSSAKPDSVEHMVDRCFASHRECLRAIWARDTLGLSKAAYERKVQTTKNLQTVWNAFTDHSNKTTLLMDDSPLKARLQPSNHLCVPEYNSGKRKHDLAAKAQASSARKQDANSEGAILEYDQTLVAVIGILEHIHDLDDVSAWISSNGLLSINSNSASSPPVRSTPDDHAPSVNSSSDVESSSTPSEHDSTLSVDESAIDIPSDIPSIVFWHEDPNIIGQWAEQGRQALSRLGIQLVPGI